MKICSKCKKKLPKSQFYQDRSRLDGLSYHCKNCDGLRTRKYNENNPEDRKARGRRGSRKYRKNHPDRVARATADWEKNNPERKRLHRQKSEAKRLETDGEYRFRKYARFRVWDAITNQKGIKSLGTEKLVGCSWEVLTKHFEKLFQLGMTWENCGRIWDHEHTTPAACYDCTKVKEQKLAFHFTNLRPLSVEDHRIKTSLDVSIIAMLKRLGYKKGPSFVEAYRQAYNELTSF